MLTSRRTLPFQAIALYTSEGQILDIQVWIGTFLYSNAKTGPCLYVIPADKFLLTKIKLNMTHNCCEEMSKEKQHKKMTMVNKGDVTDGLETPNLSGQSHMRIFNPFFSTGNYPFLQYLVSPYREKTGHGGCHFSYFTHKVCISVAVGFWYPLSKLIRLMSWN